MRRQVPFSDKMRLVFLQLPCFKKLASVADVFTSFIFLASTLRL